MTEIHFGALLSFNGRGQFCGPFHDRDPFWGPFHYRGQFLPWSLTGISSRSSLSCQTTRGL